MSRKRTRSLRPDEEELWDKVRSSTVPMHSASRKVIKDAIERPKPKQPKPALQPFSLGERASSAALSHNIAPSISQQVAAAPLQMDRKHFGKLKKGKLAPEGRLDLHGMTLAQAQPALIRFIMWAHSENKRLVLVITGKGKHKPDDGPIPVRLGVLKHQVPHWLHSAPLKSMVLQVSEAHLKHGGTGAYYVYLRRNR